MITNQLEAALGQPFTFRSLNERRLSSAEADQQLSSQGSQDRNFSGFLTTLNGARTCLIGDTSIGCKHHLLFEDAPQLC